MLRNRSLEGRELVGVDSHAIHGRISAQHHLDDAMPSYATLRLELRPVCSISIMSARRRAPARRQWRRARHGSTWIYLDLLGALSSGLCRPIARGLLIAGGGPHDGAYDDQRSKDGGGNDPRVPGALIDIAGSDGFRLHRRQRIDLRGTLRARVVRVLIAHAKPPSSSWERAVPCAGSTDGAPIFRAAEMIP